jgi:hypothetical protein
LHGFPVQLAASRCHVSFSSKASLKKPRNHAWLPNWSLAGCIANTPSRLKDTQRPQLETMLAFLREGDTVVVHSMDRLARNLDDLRRLVQQLTRHAIRIEFVKEAVCRIFNRALSGQPLPKHLSTDHDPLFRFHRWRAYLRVLEIDEIKTVPFVPRSHPFIERLIGTLRREYLDHVLFWTRLDLQRKLGRFATYYNQARVHSAFARKTPYDQRGRAPARIADLQQFSWQVHCHGLFHTPIAA